MVVQHNITAMNANRMLGVTTTGQAKSTEKLSSGYKINRAADDAAGLSISEKMRKQIRGLSQASDNAEDGISCVQTAEGALTEVHSMLQRMNELAVKAGNGTMSEDDRQNVQDEIDQLVDEIDRVSETTKFNETYLLKGDDTGAKTYSASYKTPVTNDIGYAANKTAADLAWYAEGGTTKLTLDELKSDYLEVGTDGKVALKEGKKLYTEAADTTGQYGAQKKDKIAAVADIQAVLTAKSTALTLQDGTAVKEADLANYFDADGTYKGGLYKAATDGTATEVGAEQIANYVKVTASNASDLLLSFQVGADTTSENKITVAMQSMSAKSIGVDQLKVTGSDSTNADKAVDTISDAIKKVSKQRSALGAVQNRLEHTISNLDNVVENTTSAESRIRDTDMAEEMVSYSKNNILMQAGQSMLAQANQQNQGVLSLLQ
ncbi:flagellin [Lachnospira pectinoschiza]|uniref:flagellin N-terminal helical domain-containing protein n=1 Tax=Lachnospira pectinoschiza TaxID=28052 RepID=UPI001D0704FC|nr:flagellin [Lachnospira pectinoschiza]MCB6142596.1 flagellin [Lachnospira pectinoschiza]